MFIDPQKEFFIPNDTEMERIRAWLHEHAKTCPYLQSDRKLGWFGSPIHYIITPCSIGTIFEIKCNCGAEAHDIADVDNHQKERGGI